MKNCQKCGKPLAENSLFCSNCGEKTEVPNLDSTSITENVDAQKKFNLLTQFIKKKSKMLSRKVIVIGCVLIGLIVCILGVNLYNELTYSESQAVLSAIESGNYSEADEIYKDEVDGDRALEVEVERALESMIEDLLVQYNEEALQSDDVEILLSTIDKSNILDNETIDDAYLEFEGLLASKNAYSLAQDEFNDGNYLDAISQYELVSNDDVNYDISQEQIIESNLLYKNQALTLIDEAINDNDFQTAFALLDVTLNELGEDSDVVSAYQDCETAYENYTVETTITSANALMDDGDYSSAYNTLLNQTYVFENNLDLTSALSTCVTEYIAYTLEEAENAFYDGGDYVSSIKLINMALLDLADEAQLSEALDYYTSYYPVWIGDLLYYEVDGYYSDKESKDITDNTGETYTGYVYVTPTGWDEWGSMTFAINGEYETLSGRIIIGYSNRYLTIGGSYIIYGDGVELFNSGILAGNAAPVDFEVDLTGVMELTISSRESSASNGITLQAYLVDTYLSKDVPEEVNE